jgi:hypothetical protein
MEPDDVVRASLTAFELGEVICSPGLEDAELLEALAELERTLFRSGTGGGLASRYAG